MRRASQLAILETGLGGRLDATTAARAEVVAITPVALDHQEYLGETLAEIAAEKAAIIRPGVTAVVAPQEPEALDVILETLRRLRRRAALEPKARVKVARRRRDGTPARHFRDEAKTVTRTSASLCAAVIKSRTPRRNRARRNLARARLSSSTRGHHRRARKRRARRTA